LVHVGPPQSLSVSAAFLTPSVHDAAWHVPDVHTEDTQSVLAVQILLVPQRAQMPAPPQSLSDSPPFFRPSEHVGAWHLPLWHEPLSQSVPAVHVLPGTQGGHTPPPQSMADSPPFCAPSLHLGAAHTLFGAGEQ
jgi:hypothetical protein